MRRALQAVIALAGLIALTGVAPAAGAGPVRLKALPELRKDADSLPRLVSGASPAVIRAINGVFAKLDAQALRAAHECGETPQSSYERSSTTTMQGPRFLSLVAYEGFFCDGAAHPDNNQQPLVFDLTTGSLVDWEKLLPGKVKLTILSAADRKLYPFDRTVSSDALWTLYKAAVLTESPGSDCASTLAEGQLDFRLTLDAEKAALVVDEVGLRHAVQACGTTLYLSGAELKSFGAAPELLAALDAAHSLLPPAAK